MSEKRDKPEECECCQFVTERLESYRPNVGSRHMTDRWLCGLCAGTMTSTFDDYPAGVDRGMVEVMKVVCYVGNVVLGALEKGTR